MRQLHVATAYGEVSRQLGLDVDTRGVSLQGHLDDGLLVARAARDRERLGEPERVLPDGDVHGPGSYPGPAPKE